MAAEEQNNGSAKERKNFSVLQMQGEKSVGSCILKLKML
jgi:hypothetical protein